MNAEAVQRAAQELWSAWATTREVVRLPAGCRPERLDEGYAIQLALDRLAGDEASTSRGIGWKIAATSERVQAELGVRDPLAGRLWQRDSVPPGSEVELEGLLGIAEAEIAFTIGRSLLAADAPHDRDAVTGAVAAVHPALELPASRLKPPLTAPELVADCAAAGVFCVGAGIEGFPLQRLAHSSVSVWCDGRLSATGNGGDVCGDPVNALQWLANHLAQLGRSLAQGALVLTGAAALTRDLSAGSAVEARFEWLGSVSLVLT